MGDRQLKSEPRSEFVLRVIVFLGLWCGCGNGMEVKATGEKEVPQGVGRVISMDVLLSPSPFKTHCISTWMQVYQDSALAIPAQAFLTCVPFACCLCRSRLLKYLKTESCLSYIVILSSLGVVMGRTDPL